MSLVFYISRDEQTATHTGQTIYCATKTTIHQLTTMLTTSKNVLFPGHNHLLTTGIDDPTLLLTPDANEDDYNQVEG